jgi:biotin transporter BioY
MTEQRTTHNGPSGRSAAELVTAPLAAAGRVIPSSPVPVVLGAAALALAGAIDWPVAGAIGLGYFALRRWR